MGNDISLNYVVAKRAMSMIAAQGRIGHLDTIGISIDDFNKVVSDTPWVGQDRNRVTVALNTLMSGILDAAGQARFSLPCEWVAAAIAVFVAPINIHLACRYVERPASAADLGKGIDEPDYCTAQQLFALIVQFHGSSEHSEARQQFERNTKLKLEALAIKEPEENPGKKGK